MAVAEAVAEDLRLFGDGRAVQEWDRPARPGNRLCGSLLGSGPAGTPGAWCAGMALFSAQDLRFAFRNLQTRPGLSAVIIATLGLGIGATTATFSLLDATLLRPLPFERADRLVFLGGGPERASGAPPPEVADWGAQNHTLTGVSAYDPISLNLRTEAVPTGSTPSGES